MAHYNLSSRFDNDDGLSSAASEHKDKPRPVHLDFFMVRVTCTVIGLCLHCALISKHLRSSWTFHRSHQMISNLNSMPETWSSGFCLVRYSASLINTMQSHQWSSIIPAAMSCRRVHYIPQDAIACARLPVQCSPSRQQVFSTILSLTLFSLTPSRLV